MESPEQVKSFKNWVCDHDYDLHNVFRSERILLSEAHWDLCLDTPANMQDNIPAVLSVMQYIYDNIMYAELNTKSDYC